MTTALALPVATQEQLDALLLPDPDARAMVQSALDQAGAMLPLTTPGEVLEAQQFKKDVEDFRNQLEDRRKEVKAPVLDLCRTIDDHVKDLITGLNTAANFVKMKLGDYESLQRRRVHEAEQAARAQAQTPQYSTPPITPELIAAKTEAEQVKVKTRKHTEYVVTDWSQVPHEYLILDTAKVKAAYKNGFAVPGTAAISEQRPV